MGVLSHPLARPPLQQALAQLHYPLLTPYDLHTAITHNDILAAVCARLLLWTDPHPLPTIEDGPEAGWAYYVRNWRPGKPHRHTWDAHWAEGWHRAAPAGTILAP